MRTSAITFVLIACLSAQVSGQEWKSGIEWQEPPVVTPGSTNSQPPSDAVVLFDGTDLSAFEEGDNWKVEDGVAIPQKKGITTKQKFGDLQLHVEWSSPTEIKGKGQGRGNSGVYIMGKYEIQILDSYDNKTYFDGQAGSVYKQTPPMANAMRKPGEWNTYDIFFTAPSFKEDGEVERPAYVTVVHNGILVLNHFEFLGPTSYVAAPAYKKHDPTGPIFIQFHGNPVRFRNIWVREPKPPVGKRTSEPFNIVKGKHIFADGTEKPASTEVPKAEQKEKTPGNDEPVQQKEKKQNKKNDTK